jgi:hypothetical protein
MTHLPHVSSATVAAAFMASALTIAVSPIAALGDVPQPFLPDINITSTIPANGDLNPYGVAFVPVGFPSGGPLAPGDILVSNCNNTGNTQGTGTTIIQFTPDDTVAPGVPPGQPPGNATTFFQGPTGLGLTTALGILTQGFVLVGNVPTSSAPDGTLTIQQGSLLILDRKGKQLAALTNQLNDPWDLTIDDELDHATVFVFEREQHHHTAKERHRDAPYLGGFRQGRHGNQHDRDRQGVHRRAQ